MGKREKGSKGTRMGAAGEKAVKRGNATPGQFKSAKAYFNRKTGQGKGKRRRQKEEEVEYTNSTFQYETYEKRNNKSPQQFGPVYSSSSSDLSSDLLSDLIGLRYNIPNVSSKTKLPNSIKYYKSNINVMVKKLEDVDGLLKNPTNFNLKEANTKIDDLRKQIGKISQLFNDDLNVNEDKKPVKELKKKLEKFTAFFKKRVIKLREFKKKKLENKKKKIKKQETKKKKIKKKKKKKKKK